MHKNNDCAGPHNHNSRLGVGVSPCKSGISEDSQILFVTVATDDNPLVLRPLEISKDLLGQYLTEASQV